MATIVATHSFHQACERASHQAIGVPTINRITVVTAASSNRSHHLHYSPLA
jgi:hypothetical protein